MKSNTSRLRELDRQAKRESKLSEREAQRAQRRGDAGGHSTSPEAMSTVLHALPVQETGIRRGDGRVMDAAGLVEHCRGELDRIERQMLDAPELILQLRQEREAAQVQLLLAEMAVVAEEQARERPTRDQLWEFWSDCRILGRRRMSARTKSKAVRWFGPHYARLPW